MKKKLLSLLLTAAMIFTTLTVPAIAADATAKPSKQTFYLDEVKVDVAAYSINSSNYVKLRDICKLADYRLTYETLTGGQFVTYYYTKQSYNASSDANDGVMPTADAPAKSTDVYAIFNRSYLNNFESGDVNLKTAYTLTAYKIAGNNYIQLRNFAESVTASGVAPDLKAFDVRYNPADNSVHIYTKTAYTGKDIGDNSPVATPTPTPTPIPTPAPTPTPMPVVIYTSVPTVGDRPTAIEKNSSVSWTYLASGSKGSDCNWWARNRFIEVHSITENFVYQEIKDTYNTGNKYATVTDLNLCPELSIGVYYILDPDGINANVSPIKGMRFAHYVFIEYVERDNKGNPTNVYYTEGGVSGVEPGIVKLKTWAEFQKTNTGADLVCYIVKK